METLLKRIFGQTGLSVSALGLGAAQIGDANVPDSQAQALLDAAVDAGVTLIDTARMYGSSEERIGRNLSRRRKEIVLSTKVGYDIPGQEDWTYDCVKAAIETALSRLRTDWIDIVHLHSCPLETLRKGEAILALEDAQKAGRIRIAAYSGDNEALEFAIDCGRFQSVETSVNVCDQRVIDQGLKSASRNHLGVIAKRPIANAPWRFQNRPVGQYVEEYWVRWKAMQLENLSCGMGWDELALRFAAFAPGVHSCIVGTANLDHLKRNIEAIRKGPLDPALVAELRSIFKSKDENWTGQV